MPRFHRAWLLALIPFAVWGGWNALSFDHSQKIAKSFLYLPNGDVNDNAFGAALSAAYPDGSTSDDLTRFVTKLGGSCFEGPAINTIFCGGPPEERPSQCATQVNDTLHCDLPVSATFCAAARVGFKAHLSPDRKVSKIVALGRADTC